ncbi:hypothetical protein J6590_068689 [Homalodisca vitripennis]|nr:hypothetical protein J6590_068689 [Homalodisca vitripennis]
MDRTFRSTSQAGKELTNANAMCAVTRKGRAPCLLLHYVTTKNDPRCQKLTKSFKLSVIKILHTVSMGSWSPRILLEIIIIHHELPRTGNVVSAKTNQGEPRSQNCTPTTEGRLLRVSRFQTQDVSDVKKTPADDAFSELSISTSRT